MNTISQVAKMSSDERKVKYRALLEEVETLQENEDIGLETSTKINDILQQANILFSDRDVKEQINNTDEVLLDAKVIATASNVLLNVTEAIDCSVDSYNHIEFAQKIHSKYLTDTEDNSELEVDYSKLNIIVNKLMKHAPVFNTFYGPIGDEVIQTRSIKQRQKRNKQEVAVKKAPEKITEIEKEEDSVDDTVKFLNWALMKEYETNGNKPINYFNFVIHPENFSATIENMFHLSFLVRDGRVNIYKNENNDSVIIPTSNSELKAVKRGEVTYHQSIISLDVNNWKELIKIYGIKEYFLNKWKQKWNEKKSEKQ